VLRPVVAHRPGCLLVRESLGVVGHEVVVVGAAGLGLSGWVVVNHPSDIESPAAMTHRNAVLTPQGRYRLVMRVQAGRPIAHVAAEAGIARATGVEVGRSLRPRRNPGS